MRDCEVVKCDLKIWNHKLWPQNLRLYVHIRYKPLKNDKNIYIEDLKNDNFGDSIMSKFPTNDKWHIKISSIRK